MPASRSDADADADADCGPLPDEPDAGSRTVVLDTNALMMPVECDVRLFDELSRLGFDDATLVAPAAVVAELEALADGAGEAAVAAAVGLDLVERCRVVPTAASYADDAVVALATGADAATDATATVAADAAATARADSEAGDTDADADANANETTRGGERLVVTNDRPLRDRLLAAGVRVIALRGHDKLDVTGT